MSLDVAAPQIIVPDSFDIKQATYVVIGLGRLQFHNVTAGMFRNEMSSDNEDDDEGNDKAKISKT